jgi:predicted nucleic acid-binding protein
VIYGDSSFLVALYRQGDSFHEAASRLAARLRQPLALTLLCELELYNGVQRCLASKLIDRREHDAIFRQISTDEAEGILVRCTVDQIDLYARARELSKKFTHEISARSLDILHVASAQILKPSHFITFDAKQRLLVGKTGLPLLPLVVGKK